MKEVGQKAIKVKNGISTRIPKNETVIDRFIF